MEGDGTKRGVLLGDDTDLQPGSESYGGASAKVPHPETFTLLENALPKGTTATVRFPLREIWRHRTREMPHRLRQEDRSLHTDRSTRGYVTKETRKKQEKGPAVHQ